MCGSADTMDTGENEIERRIAEAAKRALAEAEERRARRGSETAEAPKEIGGRAGPEPTRYGDWEINGIACDF